MRIAAFDIAGDEGAGGSNRRRFYEAQELAFTRDSIKCAVIAFDVGKRYGSDKGCHRSSIYKNSASSP